MIKFPCLRCGKTLRKRDGICYCVACAFALAKESLEAKDEGPRCYCDPNEGHDCDYFTGGNGYV